MKCFMSEDYEIAAREKDARVAFEKEIARRRAVLSEFYDKPLQEIYLEDGHYENTTYAVLCWKRSRFQVLTTEEVAEIADKAINKDWAMFSDNLIAKYSELSANQIGVLRKSLSVNNFRDIVYNTIDFDALKNEILRIYGDNHFVTYEERHQYKGWCIFRLERTKC